MTKTDDILRRVGEKRVLPPRSEQPAPVVQQEPQGLQRVPIAQPIRERSVYRQLMRSHDRMHTRHLKG